MDAGVGNRTLDGDDNAKLPELLKAAAVLAAGIRPRIMYLDAINSLVIGFVGAILFALVDKYEPDGPLARLLQISGAFCIYGGDLAQTATIRTCAVLASAQCGAFPPSLGARPALRLPRSNHIVDKEDGGRASGIKNARGVFDAATWRGSPGRSDHGYE